MENTHDMVEARVGFEPTNGGFADLSLGPLGYRAQCPPVYRKAAEYVSQPAEDRKSVSANSIFFHAADVAATCASRRKRADSSGGVGQM